MKLFQVMSPKIYDFFILTAQRSGSHMLASALNSHPSISCEGELGRPDDVIKSSKGEVKGAILMYRHWHMFGDQFTARKILHLVRDPYNIARSRLANEQDKKQKKWEHEAHFREKVSREFELDGKMLGEVRDAVKDETRRIRNDLRQTLHMEVSYEELTGDVSVTEIPQEVSDKLTSFLEVPSASLSTDLVKPDTTYTVND